MSLPLTAPPTSLCLLRLSAIGDVTHVLPVLRTLQQTWPETKITWIIGRLEYQLVGDIAGVEFIVLDKSQGWRAYMQLWRQLRQRRFDVLLHMQVSLRASLASLCIKSPIKLGFDKARARDFQWLFSNQRIAAKARQHVLDGFFEFVKALGINERILRWDIPLPKEDREWADIYVDDKPLLIINPSSSQRANNWRNWQPERYAAVIAHAIEYYGMQVVLTGGPNANEMQLVDDILQNPVFENNAQLLASIHNLVGKTSLKQLAALMKVAVAVIAPDTGPAHIANAVGVPVIGLYATSNPNRTGPYLSQINTVNVYPEALVQFEKITEDAAPWGKRVRHSEALDLITVDEVQKKLAQVMVTKIQRSALNA